MERTTRWRSILRAPTVAVAKRRPTAAPTLGVLQLVLKLMLAVPLRRLVQDNRRSCRYAARARWDLPALCIIYARVAASICTRSSFATWCGCLNTALTSARRHACAPSFNKTSGERLAMRHRPPPEPSSPLDETSPRVSSVKATVIDLESGDRAPSVPANPTHSLLRTSLHSQPRPPPERLTPPHGVP